MSDKKTRLRVIVLCSNSNGEPEFHSCMPEVTESEKRDGVHYERAKENAQWSGFAPPMIAFDGTDPAAKQLGDLHLWL